MTEALLAVTSVPYANADLAFTEDPPEVDDVSRAHVVAVTPAGDVVVCRSVEEWRFLPGGTREPDESVRDLIARELREEAGCALSGEPRFLGRYVATSRSPAPYRPHLPHPVASWAYYVAPSRSSASRSTRPTGSRSSRCSRCPPADAAAWLREHDAVHADVVVLAAQRGLLS